MSCRGATIAAPKTQLCNKLPGMQQQDRIPELDGIRGLAIILVLICHADNFYPTMGWLDGFFNAGWIGVQLFFVLSGYLITGILRRTQESGAYYSHFYIRRAARILPLYLVILPAAFALSYAFGKRQVNWWAYFLMLQNFLSANSALPFLIPAWSLAVEEQYYAVWPLLNRLLKRSVMVAVCCGILIVSPVLRYTALNHATDPWCVLHTQYNLDGIALGSLLALLTTTAKRRAALPLLIIGCAGLAALKLIGNSDLYASLLLTFLCPAFAGIICSPPRLFASPLLRWCGERSYGIYLLHFPIFAWYSSVGIPFLFALLVTLALAFVSWDYLESPLLNAARTRTRTITMAGKPVALKPAVAE